MFCRLGSCEDRRPGRGDRLVVAGVDAPGAGVALRGQLVRVRGLELRQPAVPHDESGQLELERKLFQHVLGGRWLARRGAPLHRQRELAEQHILELLGRIEVEARPGGGVRCLLEGEQTLRDLEALQAQHVRVDQHAAVLHLEQHAEQRPLDVLVHGFEPRQPVDLGPEPLVQPEGDVGTLGRVLRRAFDRHLVERQLLRPPAGDVLEPCGLDPEVTRRDRIEVVPCGGAVEHVGFEHRVVAHAGKLDAVVAQDMRVELEMVSCLGARWILEHRPQGREYPRPVELRGRARIVVRERDVGGMTGLAAQGDTDDLGPHVVERGRLDVECHQRGAAQPFEPRPRARPR